MTAHGVVRLVRGGGGGVTADSRAAGVPAVTTPGTATNSTAAGGEADVGDACAEDKASHAPPPLDVRLELGRVPLGLRLVHVAAWHSIA